MRIQRTLSNKKGALALAVLVAALAGCGGGDGAETPQAQANPQFPNSPATGTPESPTTPVTPGKPTSLVAPSCLNCGAVDSSTYAGTGVGVWQATNATSAAADVPVSIDGLTGQDVTLVFTNESGVAQPMPAISLTASRFPSVAASQLRWQDPATDAKQRIGEFNRNGWAALAGSQGTGPRYSMSSGPSKSVVNDTRDWFNEDNSVRSTTLVRQATTTDGVTVNFWVENSENGPTKVSSAIIDQLADRFASAGKVYDMLKDVGGPLWGSHNYSNLISGTGQPIDIVILNFDHNNAPYGMTGYFYARNAIAKSASNPYSNESLSLYLDSETLYLDGATGLTEVVMTMAHEGTHAQNFYRRGVLGGVQYMFATWLEEATAMMMEDFASATLDPGHNPIRDVRFYDYVKYKGGSYNCSLLDWTPFSASCDSYSVSGSFGGFLNRQLGLRLYKSLLGNMSSTNSVDVLDTVIKTNFPGTSFVGQFRRFSATAGALIPAATSPNGFGFPARSDNGYNIPAIDPTAYAPYRTLTQTVPTTLQAYASLPVVRQAVKGRYTETVKVPAGTTLAVVIH
ncbi:MULTISPECIES: M30 family zinc metallopeptidase [Cupriavidus]|jgi:hypothetical protein|uniref:M30 family zinc metallopeptidase n=1 Tax=Cupriavidus TaxID=106589 RepID=UPI000CE06D63|nr:MULTISPECIES: hemagglutinin [Cupriavidus]AVA38157.1 hemagglutinin [Cupriavidus metallidurans]QWE98218.1 hemagglutinin [Cupriavidus sp. EM10]